MGLVLNTTRVLLCHFVSSTSQTVSSTPIQVTSHAFEMAILSPRDIGVRTLRGTMTPNSKRRGGVSYSGGHTYRMAFPLMMQTKGYTMQTISSLIEQC